MSEAVVKDDVMSMLFEGDKDASSKDSKYTMPDIDSSKIEKALKNALLNAGAKPEDIADKVEVFSAQSLDESTGLGEADESAKAIDFKRLNSVLNNGVKDFVNSKLKKSIDTSWFIGVAHKDDVLSFLKDHSLGSDADYENLDKDFAVVFLTYPKAKGLPSSRGKKTKTGEGTRGYKFFDNDTVKRIINSSLDSSGDFKVFTVKGKPSKANVDSTIFKGSKDKDTLTYYGTDVIPECKIYLAPIDLKNSNSTEEGNQRTSDPSDKINVRKKLNKAYVLMFNTEIVVPVSSAKADVNVSDDNKDVKRNDRYIIPMPGLQYEDPEYANKNLK